MNPAYLAGLIDGEGTFSIHWEPQYRKSRQGFTFLRIEPKIAIGMNKKERCLLDLIRDEFGGKVYTYPEYNRLRGVAVWTTTNRAVVERIIKLVLPHIILKKKVAMLLLEAINILKKREAWEYARPRDVILEIAKISDTIHELACVKGPRRKYTYQYIEKLTENLADSSLLAPVYARLRHAKENPEKAFPCVVCGKPFRRRNVRNYFCSMTCFRAFQTKDKQVLQKLVSP